MNSEATQSTLVYDLLTWLEVNKKKVMIGIAIVIGLGLLIAFYRFHNGEQEKAASKALLDIPVTAIGSRTQITVKPGDYLKIADNYPGTVAGQNALLLTAVELFKEGKFSEAQSQFEKFLNKSGNDDFAAQAAFGVAVCLEAEKKTDEALSNYQSVLTRYPNSSPVNQAKMATGRIYEGKNQPELALKSYDDLIRDKTPNIWSAEARTRRELLIQKQPQLAGTNANPAVLVPKKP